jgi:predicted ferric reductase
LWKRLWRIALYVFLIMTPAVLATFVIPQPGFGLVYRMGRGFALTAFMILMLQPVLTGRFKWIEGPFGLDVIMLTHKYADVFVVLLLLSHPLLLAFGGAGSRILIALDQPWYIWIAKLTLVTLLVAAFVSVFRLRARLKFEQWRIIHNILVPAVFLMAFAHSWFAGGDLQAGPLRWIWPVMLGLAFAVFVYHRLIQPLKLGRHPYRVIDVRQETKNVWTIKFAPPESRKCCDYKPGQFQFITFQRGRNLPVEEHHWTISSSPTEKDTVSSTIKESGDFTSTIGQTRPGDTAVIQAAYGRFSHVLHPEEKDFVFVAGGIGITPLMSMLRHMRDTRAVFRVLLIYANSLENDIIFHRELASMEMGGYLRLKVVHVLSRPGKDWTGETGHIDRERINRLCDGDFRERAFYVCGPKGLLKATLKNLRGLGVAGNRIHFEIFSFPN